MPVHTEGMCCILGVLFWFGVFSHCLKGRWELKSIVRWQGDFWSFYVCSLNLLGDWGEWKSPESRWGRVNKGNSGCEIEIFFLARRKQEHSSSTEALYLVSDSATGDSEMLQTKVIPASLKWCIPTCWHWGKSWTSSSARLISDTGQAKKKKNNWKRQKYQHPHPQILRAKRDEEIVPSDLIWDWIFPQVFLHWVW